MTTVPAATPRRAGVPAGGLQVSRYTGSAAEWDAFVRSQASWTHCHLYGWRAVMERVFGHECVYMSARDAEGALEGVLPLVRVRSVLFGHFLVSMPFLNHGGPLGSDRAVVALAAAAAEVARDDGATLLELRCRVILPLPLHVSTRKITVVLDLPRGGPEVLWAQLSGKVRSQVRRPSKEGVRVEFGADQLGPFYSVFARHMRDLGTPSQSRRLFETIAEQFPGDVWFGCAYLGRTAIAAGCGLQWGTEVEMTWASALRSHAPIAANMLLYWAFIERAAEAGLARFDFGRCTPGAGTHRFKRQWGGHDEQLWWYEASFNARTAKTPSPDDPAYAWGPRAWKRLPVGLATALGPHIVKYIP